jgi:putative hemolysin
LFQPPRTLESISAGPYVVRLARVSSEVEAAQRLRYDVMYGEWGGKPDPVKLATQSDADEWDPYADHIIVMDSRSDDKVVGTLRLVRNICLEPGQHFYTEAAFDLSKLRTRYSKILELTRFCIDPGGRHGVILMLIWKFAMQFIAETRTEVMMGCASFTGVDPNAHGDVLHHLQREHLAPQELRPPPVVDNFVRINDLSDTAVDGAERKIPTLLRGYLKLGARVSDTAIIDPVFNSTFIFVYVDAANMAGESTVLVTARGDGTSGDRRRAATPKL